MRRPRRAYLIGGGVLLFALVLVMIFAPQLTRVSPDYWDAKPSILMGTPPFPPGPGHLIGTDQWGRDMWSRVVYGTRWSMLFAFLITAGRLLIAAPAAFLAAFGPRRISWLVDRCYVITSAIPPLLVYILLLSAPQMRVIGVVPSVALTVLLLTVIEWPRLAVMLKGRLESLMAEPFIEGAVAAGSTRWQLFKNHLFPHLWPVLLQLVSAEMARALLAIAQMAIFGIMIGGGVINILDNGHGGDKYVLTTGLSEWGSLLSDGRMYVQTNPWIPMAPAFAFLISMVGFSLFSQGLETVFVSIQTLKDATTGRLSRHWRWAWAAVAACAVLWYFQGLPWNREAGIEAVAQRQAEALNTHNIAAFDATLAPRDWGQDPDLSRWAAGLSETAYERVSIKPESISVNGSRANATWVVEVGYRDKPPAELALSTDLVRRFGRWYVTGEPNTTLRGFATDVVAKYDPVDPSAKAVPMRFQVQYLATAADHAFEAVAAYFPQQTGAPRPILRFYTNQAAYDWAVGQSGAGSVCYFPGEPIRVSPAFFTEGKRWDTERSLAYEMIKFLTRTRLGKDQVDPLVIGAYELSVDKNLSTYRINVDRLAGQRLLSLPELYSLRIEQLDQGTQYAYATESALLVEFMKNRLGGKAVAAAGSAELAQQLNLTPAELEAQYGKYVVERIYSESLLTVPAAKSRVPEGLAEAIAASKPTLPAADGSAKPAEYRASYINSEERGAKVDVLVLEELTMTDGRMVAGVVRQTWSRRSDNQWTMDPAPAL